MSILKSERQRRGIDLKEVAQVTRISSSYLRAIEDLDFAHLPVEVYTRSYIKDYARYLGVDPKEILDAYERFLLDKVEHKIKPIENIPTESPETDKEKLFSKLAFVIPKMFSAPLLKLGTVFIITAVVGVAFYWIQTLRFETDTKVVQYNPPPINKKVDQSDTQDTTKVKDTETNEPTSKNNLSNPTRHNLKITATEKVWLQVVIDGKETKEITLSPGENLTYTADEYVNLLIGNAGGIRIVFDDKVIDNLGASGKVVRLRLPQPNSNT